MSIGKPSIRTPHDSLEFEKFVEEARPLVINLLGVIRNYEEALAMFSGD